MTRQNGSSMVRINGCVAAVLAVFTAFAMSCSLPGVAASSGCVTYDEGTGTWVVAPSGGDDTANIQYAFDQAAAAGPGGTVELTEGQFYCNNIVVYDFVGTVKGAGKGLTRIDTLRALDPDAPPLGNPIDSVALFHFVGGDTAISDMTFEITPFYPSVIYGRDEYCGTWMYLIDAIVRFDGRYVSSQVERVEFIGHEGAGYAKGSPMATFNEEVAYPFNCHVGIRICDLCSFHSMIGLHTGPTTGKHIVRQCYFEHFVESVAAFGLSEGELLVGGSEEDANTFTYCGGVILRNIEDSIVEISHNKFGATGDPYDQVIFCYNDIKPKEQANPIELITSPSQVEISHNTFTCDGYSWCEVIFLDDDGPSIAEFYGMAGEACWSLEVVVSDNVILLDQDTSVGGIYGFGIQDALVTGNHISGGGRAGMAIAPGPYGYDGWLELCSGWTIVNNDFTGMDADVADIWLGPFSEGCYVECDSSDIVLDEGIDNTVIYDSS